MTMTKGREWNVEVNGREEHSDDQGESRMLVMAGPTERKNKTLTEHGHENECHRQEISFQRQRQGRGIISSTNEGVRGQ